MLRRLALPAYESVAKYEGLGNFAVSRYYKWPYRAFYRKKLKMMLGMLGNRVYRNCLDFGAGKANIFAPTLSKASLSVKSVDIGDYIDPRWKFDLITCGSVIEFTRPETLDFLAQILAPNGTIIIASPMDTWLSRAYFKLIRDNRQRHSHTYILSEVSKRFRIVKYKTWLGLYFCIKAEKR